MAERAIVRYLRGDEPMGRVLGLALVTLGLVSAGDAGQPAGRILPGTAVEHAIAPGEAQHYEILVPGGGYLRVVVEQQQCDVIVDILRPDGSPVSSVNNPEERSVPEVISFVARGPEPEAYRLEIRQAPGDAPCGPYLIRSASRPAQPEDSRRVAAERAEAAADRLYLEHTALSLKRALAGYEEALARWREVKEPSKQGEMLFRIGVMRWLCGDGRAAVDWLEQALAVERRLDDSAWQATVLNSLGLVLDDLGSGDRALAAFAAALALRRAGGEMTLAARVLNNIGRLQHHRGQLVAARAAYDQALAIFRQSGDRRRESIALDNLGSVDDGLGEPFAALPLHEQALTIARQIGDRGIEAQALNSLGLTKRHLGEPQAALESWSAALAIFRQRGDRLREAAALNNVGSLYLDLGEPDKASAPFEQALHRFREMGAPAGEAAARDNLGRTQSLLGRPKLARASFARALALERAAGSHADEAATLSNLGHHLTAAGRPREALAVLVRALALRQELGDRPGEARARRELGAARLAAGDLVAAELAFTAALALDRETGDPLGEEVALQGRARIALARGDLAAAGAALEPAIALVESLRLRIAVDSLRSSYFASVLDTYELEIERQMALARREPGAGHEARAFMMAERARARSLLDRLRAARVELGRGTDPAVAGAERQSRLTLNAKAERLAALLSKPGDIPERVAEETQARRDLAEAERRYELAEAQLRTASGALAGWTSPETPTLGEVQALIGADTLLLEFSLGEARSFLWAITARSCAAFELPGRRVVDAAARAVHDALGRPAARGGGERRRALKRLSRMLLGPVPGLRPTGATDHRLVVVAGGALQYVPFAALPLAAGEPLVERYEVVHLPSMAVLAELRRKASGGADRTAGAGALAILADPVFAAVDPRVDRSARMAGGMAPVSSRSAPAAENFPRLPWSRREAEAAASHATGHPVFLALDFQANAATAAGPEVAAARVIHFATHGIVDEEHPELSGLVLAQVDRRGRTRPGYLRLDDIYGLHLAAQLVVLSGCRTALGREVRGEGLMGLTRGFFYAGASTVMASLWPVRDRATAELMARFYAALLVGNRPPAAALRIAQRSLRRDPRWRDPYFWAPFIVQGDWLQAR